GCHGGSREDVHVESRRRFQVERCADSTADGVFPNYSSSLHVVNLFKDSLHSFRLVSDCEPLRAPGQVLRASSNKMVRSRRPTAEARSQEAIRRSTSSG